MHVKHATTYYLGGLGPGFVIMFSVVDQIEICINYLILIAPYTLHAESILCRDIKIIHNIRTYHLKNLII